MQVEIDSPRKALSDAIVATIEVLQLPPRLHNNVNADGAFSWLLVYLPEQKSWQCVRGAVCEGCSGGGVQCVRVH